MSNVTMAIDDELLHEARVLAAKNRTTVNAMFREFLENAVRGADDSAVAKRAETARRLEAIWERIDTSPPINVGRLPTREEMYESDERMRRMLKRHVRS